MTPPLLLLGFQRSGTTALATAVAEAFAREGGVFTVNGKLMYYLPRWLTDVDIAARHLRADEIVYSLARREPLGPSVDDWLRQTESAVRWAAHVVANGHWKGTAAELARTIVDRAYSDHPRWGEKYNEYLLDLPSLTAMVPQARLLMLVRHPSEVAASMLDWSGDRPWRPETVEACIAKWTHWNRMWLDFAPHLADDSWLVVDYADMCRCERTKQMVADFAEVPRLALSGRLVQRRPAVDGPIPPGAAGTWERLRAMATEARSRT